MKTWTLSRRVTALCMIAAIVLGGIAVTAAVAAQTNRDQVRELLDRIGPLRTDAAQLLTVMVDQETGVRGFALTRDESFLAPYTAGIDTERKLIGDMRGFARDAGVVAGIDEVERQASEWRAVVAEPVLAAVRAGDTTSVGPILDSSKSRFDRLRAEVDTLQNRVAAVRERAADDIRTTENRVVTLLILAAIVVVIAGILLAVLLRRLVTRPVLDLASEVRLVAEGDYSRRLTATGPPEVARLAADVNGMRRQIVADLETVGRSRQQLEAANEQLELQAAELTRSNRDLEQFAYVASHDLQEPLRKVASFCQLLQRRYAGQLDERADQYIAFAVDGAQRMQRLINDLLAFSRIGRITSGFTEISLNNVVTDAASHLDSRREQLNATVSWSDLPVVRGEEPLLVALFTNLIGNSLKFRHPDRPPTIRITAEQIDGEWQISCQDNGIGIEQEYADKVFVIFQRLHPKDQYPGTGIGLAIAKKIIEFHGGRIWLEPDVTEGTLFRFTLPVVEPEQPAAVEPTADTPAAADTEVPTRSPTPVAADEQSALVPAAAETAAAEETSS